MKSRLVSDNRIRHIRTPHGYLRWEPKNDGRIGSLIAEMVSIDGVTVEHDPDAIGAPIVFVADVGKTVDSDVEVQDSGQALIAHIDDDAVDPHLFVKLQSWDEEKFDPTGMSGHPTFNKRIRGKRVRITIEVLDD